MAQPYIAPSCWDVSIRTGSREQQEMVQQQSKRDAARRSHPDSVRSGRTVPCIPDLLAFPGTWPQSRWSELPVGRPAQAGGSGRRPPAPPQLMRSAAGEQPYEGRADRGAPSQRVDPLRARTSEVSQVAVDAAVSRPLASGSGTPRAPEPPPRRTGRHPWPPRGASAGRPRLKNFGIQGALETSGEHHE